MSFQQINLYSQIFQSHQNSHPQANEFYPNNNHYLIGYQYPSSNLNVNAPPFKPKKYRVAQHQPIANSKL